MLPVLSPFLLQSRSVNSFVVFQKKDILFGNHMVKERVSTKSKKDASTIEAKRRPRSVIVVEGYMDAIALWQAGVQETVASMGTALTKEQLFIAAEKARKIGGKTFYVLVVRLHEVVLVAFERSLFFDHANELN